ncbi:hypothetical protein BE17_36190 [Sorangium cellulosum]|uniref:Fungal lipase-type domain-containing protein n=1 Tax=Sorangium cellulosum TaxID=56 RepID=A0A150SIL5_SORCE|nr:hypothetical protein BE17_36190 [Sorangium cellulosum]
MWLIRYNKNARNRIAKKGPKKQRFLRNYSKASYWNSLVHIGVSPEMQDELVKIAGVLEKFLNIKTTYEFPLKVEKPSIVAGKHTKKGFTLTEFGKKDSVAIMLEKGDYWVTEEDGDKTIDLSRIPGWQKFLGVRSAYEKSDRRQTAQAMGLGDMWHILLPLAEQEHTPLAQLESGTMTDYEDFEARQIRRIRASQRAKAMLKSTDSIDEFSILPEYAMDLRSLYGGDTPPDGLKVIRLVREMITDVALEEPMSREKALAAGRILCVAALAAERYAPILALPGVYQGDKVWHEAMVRLSQAKLSTDLNDKTAYVVWMRENIFPYLTSELTFFNALALTLAYMALKIGVMIRRSVKVFELSDPRDDNSDRARVFKLEAVYEEVVGEELVQKYLRRDIEFRPDAKYQVWKAVNGRPEFIVNVAGTTSIGENFDKLWEARGVTTGAYGNEDPKGCAFSAHRATIDILLDMLKKVGADKSSHITITGHSQGGALAIRIQAALLSLGYENVYCVAHSAPAIDPETVDLMRLLSEGGEAGKRLIRTESWRDPVPRGGLKTPYGWTLENWGNRNPTGQSSVVKFDPIEHGYANDAMAQIIGLPSSWSSTYNIDKGSRILDWLGKATITQLLRPTPHEKGYVEWARALRKQKDDFNL